MKLYYLPPTSTWVEYMGERANDFRLAAGAQLAQSVQLLVSDHGEEAAEWFANGAWVW